MKVGNKEIQVIYLSEKDTRLPVLADSFQHDDDAEELIAVGEAIILDLPLQSYDYEGGFYCKNGRQVGYSGDSALPMPEGYVLSEEALKEFENGIAAIEAWNAAIVNSEWQARVTTEWIPSADCDRMVESETKLWKHPVYGKIPYEPQAKNYTTIEDFKRSWWESHEMFEAQVLIWLEQNNLLAL